MGRVVLDVCMAALSIIFCPLMIQLGSFWIDFFVHRWLSLFCRIVRYVLLFGSCYVIALSIGQEFGDIFDRSASLHKCEVYSSRIFASLKGLEGCWVLYKTLTNIVLGGLGLGPCAYLR